MRSSPISPDARLKTRDAVFLIAALAVLGLWHWHERPRTRAPGVLVPQAPLQRDLGAQPPAPWQQGEIAIKPLARFALDARVLSRADYHFDTGAKLVPTDLALGWGRMSDSAVLSRIQLAQGGRWWRWYSERLPIPIDEINRSAANMHMIPANDGVAAQLERVREGDVVELHGYLVEVSRARDRWHWESSLSRTDTGKGACELVWVESLRIR